MAKADETAGDRKHWRREDFPPAGIVPAAGMSSRMGAFKPLLPYGPTTLIRATVGSLLRAGAEPVAVVVGRRGDEVAEELAEHGQVMIVRNPDYELNDMFESIRLAIRALPAGRAAFVIPGDMPAVAPSTLRRMAERLDASDADAAFPLVAGRKRHPPLLSGRCLAAVSGFRGEGGLRAALAEFAGVMVMVEADDPGCGLDADTPEDYRRLLEYRAGLEGKA